MVSIDVLTLDLSPYQTAPMLPIDAMMQLGFDLDAAKPANPPAHVKKAAQRMRETAKTIKKVLVERIQGAGFDLAAEIEFDNVTDRFWSAGRRRIEYWINYADPGLRLLDDSQQTGIDLPAKRELAEVAITLDNHLFGADGLNFLRLPLRQQVVAMATRLDFIAGSSDHEVFEQVLGTDLLATLRVLQDRYETMIFERSTRDDSLTSLRNLRRVLQRHLTMYSTSVLSMLDEDEPGSIDSVFAALQPMRNARVARTGSSEELVGGTAQSEAVVAEILSGNG